MWFFLAFRNLFRNFRRTVAVLFTVALGAGALFAFDGFINGVLNQYRYNTIHANYGHGQIMTKGYRETVFEEPKEHWISNGEKLTEFLNQQKGVETVFPRASFSALLENGKITVSGLGTGIDAQKEAQFFESLNVEEGKTLTDQQNGILLGRGLAKALHVEPGDSITVMATSAKGVVNKDSFVVTGIFHTGSLDFDSRMFRIQLPKAQELMGTTKIELVSLAFSDFDEWNNVSAAVTKAFPGLEAIPFDVLDEVYYQHSVDWLKAQFRVVQIIILSIVLLGIFNTISTTILERKQEIGNLRANGESIFQVMQVIMAEGGMLAIFGSVLGMAGSALFLILFIDKGLVLPPGPGMTRNFLVSFQFGWPMVFFTLAASSLAAILASFLAGIRVARMSIASALRAH